MSTGPTINTDSRVVAAGLVERAKVVPRPVITKTGRAAPNDQVGNLRNVNLPLALIPHADYIDDPDHRPGCGFVGGRIPFLVPLLSSKTRISLSNLNVRLRKLPETADEILIDLRSRAGLWAAPGALFARTAWTDLSVATWLEGFRTNGDDGQLNVAVAQANLATRKMWYAVGWGAGASRPINLATASGAAVVGRALIDCVAIIHRLAMKNQTSVSLIDQQNAVLALLVTALERYHRCLKSAQAKSGTEEKRKLASAFAKAKTIIDAIAVFAVASDPARKRWRRLASMLRIARCGIGIANVSDRLLKLSSQLERLNCAKLGLRLEHTGWRIHVRQSLLRLATPDPQLRLKWLERIRCDLIFTLAATRRLDQLYRFFPWLAAPSGAFPKIPGGALGALASLDEAARVMEIGSDMKRCVADTSAWPGTVPRLTPKEFSDVFDSDKKALLALSHRHAAGNALVAQVTSHVMMNATLNGATFDGLSLGRVRHGDLNYDDGPALIVEETRTAVVLVQQAQPAFSINTDDDDLIRHMGLTLREHLHHAVRMIWPTANHRIDIPIHQFTIDTGVCPPANKEERDETISSWVGTSKYNIHREIVRSMLGSIDSNLAHEGQRKHPIGDAAVPLVRSGEMARSDGLSEKTTPEAARQTGCDQGQGTARGAKHHSDVHHHRSKILVEIAASSCQWPPFKQGARPPDDDLLEDVLRGRANLAQLAPVGDLPIPILWFAPLIDRERLGWIIQGMPGHQAGAESRSSATRMKSWIDATRAWAPAAFATSIQTGCQDIVACHLYTGRSSITADLAHVMS